MKEHQMRKISITKKLLLLVLGLQFVTIATLTYFNEENERTQYIKQTDEKLRLVVHSANEFVLQEYHDKILDKNSISNQEYMDLMIKLSSLVNKADIQYVYSFIKRKDEIQVTSTSVTQEDFESNNYEYFFDKYASVTQQLRDSFDNKKAFFEETRDKYGYVRTVFIPFVNKYGETYVVGADIEIKELATALMESRKRIILISLVIFVISALLYLFLSNILIRRIPIIRDRLEEFFDYLNSKRDSVTPIKMGGNDELNEMADMINSNIELIATNIKKDNDLIKELASISTEVKNGVFSSRITLEGNNPALNEVKSIFNEVLLNTQHVMLDIFNVIKEFSNQNYNSKLDDYHLDGEMAKLIEQINIFGKTISAYMLNTAYNALNLEKDSKFTNETMYKLTKQFNTYLKEVNKIQETTENLFRHNSKSLQKLESTLKEKEYAEVLISKTSNELKFMVNNSGNSKEVNQSNIKISEMLDDLQHSLTMIAKFMNDLKNINELSISTFDELNNQFKDFEDQIIDGNNSIEHMQKISSNLNDLSAKMREYIENSEFNGKDNITMLMNYSDR